jgi:hypothetical protein
MWFYGVAQQDAIAEDRAEIARGVTRRAMIVQMMSDPSYSFGLRMVKRTSRIIQRVA